jgi:hypothetical protein
MITRACGPGTARTPHIGPAPAAGLDVHAMASPAAGPFRRTGPYTTSRPLHHVAPVTPRRTRYATSRPLHHVAPVSSQAPATAQALQACRAVPCSACRSHTVQRLCSACRPHTVQRLQTAHCAAPVQRLQTAHCTAPVQRLQTVCTLRGPTPCTQGGGCLLWQGPRLCTPWRRLPSGWT